MTNRWHESPNAIMPAPTTPHPSPMIRKGSHTTHIEGLLGHCRPPKLTAAAPRPPQMHWGAANTSAAEERRRGREGQGERKEGGFAGTGKDEKEGGAVKQGCGNQPWVAPFESRTHTTERIQRLMSQKKKVVRIGASGQHMLDKRPFGHKRRSTASNTHAADEKRPIPSTSRRTAGTGPQ